MRTLIMTIHCVLAFTASVSSARDWPVAAGTQAQEQLQKALDSAGPGDVVRLAEGTYPIRIALRMARPGVTLQGAGAGRTTLSFADKPPVAGTDANGSITVAANQLTVRDLSIVDSPGPAIVGRELEGLSIRNVTVQQRLGLRPGGPPMGVRIFASRNVLFDGLTARHATVSGLQITTSDNVIVRNSRFEENSTGLEVENDYFADIHDNVMTRNATGLMLLDMPSYPHIGGHALRVFRNRIVDNNGASAAAGIARTARTGQGILIMGGEYDIHIFDNEIRNHGHASITLVALPWGIDNPAFNAVPNDVVVRNNVFGDSGFAPLDNLAALKASGETLADVVWDGAITFIAAGQVKKAEPLRLTLKDNVRADGRPVTFLSLGLGIANGGMLVAEPTRTLPKPATTTEPAPVRLPQDQR